jgi:hypothetical protein
MHLPRLLMLLGACVGRTKKEGAAIQPLERKDFFFNFFKPVAVQWGSTTVHDKFATAVGEQAACLLDKANHIATFLVCSPDDLNRDPSGGVLCSDSFFFLLQKRIDMCCTGKVVLHPKPGKPQEVFPGDEQVRCFSAGQCCASPRNPR